MDKQHLKLIKLIITPWKKKEETEYAKGWNDCLKEMGKKYRKLVKSANGN